MKYLNVLLLFVSVCISISCQEEESLPVITDTNGSSGGTAVIITGAAARITQELALLEALDNQGRLNNVTFISGVSSGAINTVMLNAVLDETNDFDWQDYKDIVLNLQQSDVLVNRTNNLPVNTQPLWTTFDVTFTDRLGYMSLNDLPISSAVTATTLDLLGLEISSNVPELSTFNGGITEVLMASASFPVAFPAIKINDNIYADGGLQENIPVRVALQYQQLRDVTFDTVYVVSYQKNTTMDWDRELGFLGVDKARKDFLQIGLERAGFDTDALSQKAFDDNLKKLRETNPDFAEKIMVYVPEIENLPYYGVFDFSEPTAKDSYEKASEWAQSNFPLSLDDYLDKL